MNWTIRNKFGAGEEHSRYTKSSYYCTISTTPNVCYRNYWFEPD